MANEKRRIDANALLDEFLKRYTERERDGNLVFAACEIKQDFSDMISNAPTVDAVEVVRCKDCMYYHKTIGICFGKCSKTRLFPYDDDFCSYGERC